MQNVGESRSLHILGENREQQHTQRMESGMTPNDAPWKRKGRERRGRVERFVTVVVRAELPWDEITLFEQNKVLRVAVGQRTGLTLRQLEAK